MKLKFGIIDAVEGSRMVCGGESTENECKGLFVTKPRNRREIKPKHGG